MAAYYPLEDNEIKEGRPGPSGVGFKLTNDGNYDIERKLLKNVADPREEGDSATKNYVDGNYNNLKEKIIILTDYSMIHGEEFFNAKQKYIKNLGDPREESDAATKKYVDELRDKSLIHDENSFDAKNKFISNVRAPQNKSDVVNREHLEYYCILWDKTNRLYYAHNERISGVKSPSNDTDCANKYYVDNKTFCATTDSPVQITGYQTFKFNKFSSKLLDSDLKLSQDMFMKVTIFIASDKANEKLKIRLEKVKELLLDKTITVNEEIISMFVHGKLKEVLTLSALYTGNNKLKPYLHIEKIEFRY